MCIQWFGLWILSFLTLITTLGERVFGSIFGEGSRFGEVREPMHCHTSGIHTLIWLIPTFPSHSFSDSALTCHREKLTLFTLPLLSQLKSCVIRDVVIYQSVLLGDTNHKCCFHCLQFISAFFGLPPMPTHGESLDSAGSELLSCAHAISWSRLALIKQWCWWPSYS